MMEEQIGVAREGEGEGGRERAREPKRSRAKAGEKRKGNVEEGRVVGEGEAERSQWRQGEAVRSCSLDAGCEST